MPKTKKTTITVTTTVHLPVAKVWKFWTLPEHIIQWNNASPDWHTPRAENDLRVGGKFLSRMEARDGSSGFDFNGVYQAVKKNKMISYILEGGREVQIRFTAGRNSTKVTETFDPETENSPDMQRSGWQAILDNFQRYAESTGSQKKVRIAGPIAPCLWFDSRAEEAAKFYVSIFPKSKIDSISRYGKEGFEIHGQKAGTVMTVNFRLNGQPFTALNGGPVFQFNEAVSFQVFCNTQAEIDHYWTKLTAGGQEVQCGWLKDKFGVSWQVTPTILGKLLKDPSRAERVTKAFLQMKKFDIEQLKKA